MNKIATLDTGKQKDEHQGKYSQCSFFLLYCAKTSEGFCSADKTLSRAKARDSACFIAMGVTETPMAIKYHHRIFGTLKSIPQISALRGRSRGGA